LPYLQALAARISSTGLFLCYQIHLLLDLMIFVSLPKVIFHHGTLQNAISFAKHELKSLWLCLEFQIGALKWAFHVVCLVLQSMTSLSLIQQTLVKKIQTMHF
jgi:hypothetical protein